MKENQKTIETILVLIEYLHSEKIHHSRRVSEFTKIILKEAVGTFQEISLTEQEQECIVSCALLHDMGENALPDCVLYQSGKLTDKEQELYRTHPLRGEEMAGMLSLILDKRYVDCLKNICRYHHERYDGEGYPDRLSGEEIPFEAQIVGLAEAFDEMISEHLYKHAYSCDEAYSRIIHGECGIFSSRLIGCFIRVKNELEQAIEDMKSPS